MNSLMRELWKSLREENTSTVSKKTLTGTFVCTQKGFGFVSVEGEEDDFYINENDMNGAFHEDTVQIEVTEERARNGRRKEARIVKILERGMTEIVGTFKNVKVMDLWFRII